MGGKRRLSMIRRKSLIFQFFHLHILRITWRAPRPLRMIITFVFPSLEQLRLADPAALPYPPSYAARNA